MPTRLLVRLEDGTRLLTKTITSQPLVVKGLRYANATVVQLSEVKIDPASKVISRMSGLGSEKSLTDAKLWEGTTSPSSDNLKKAAKCFGAIKEAYSTLPRDGKVVVQSAAFSNGVDSGRAGNAFMDALLWVRIKVKQATDWIIRKAGQVWEFVCDIGGKGVNFVLDCVEKITEAASWVWEKLKGDILECKDTIVSFLNAGCDMAVNRMKDFNNKIDSLFSNIQKTIVDATGATSRPGYKSKLASTKPKEDKQMNDLKDSAPSKWAGERVKNGNANTTKAAQNAAKDGDKDGAEFVKIWSDRVEPILKDFNTLVDDLAKDISTLFKNDHNLSQGALLSRLSGNLLVNFLEILKKLLQAIVSVVAEFVIWVVSH